MAVKQAKELHHQLDYVNTHQRCEMQEVQLKLEACHQELIESRVSRRMDGMQTAEVQDSAAKLKTAKQELKMVQMCACTVAAKPDPKKEIGRPPKGVHYPVHLCIRSYSY